MVEMLWDIPNCRGVKPHLDPTHHAVVIQQETQDATLVGIETGSAPLAAGRACRRLRGKRNADQVAVKPRGAPGCLGTLWGPLMHAYPLKPSPCRNTKSHATVI